MNFTISISPDRHHLIAQVRQNITPEVAKNLEKDYQDLIKKTGIKNILNDVRGYRDEIGDGQEVPITSRTKKLVGIPKGIRSAILVDYDDHTHDFKELAAQYAGSEVKLFYTKENAMDWLYRDKHN